MADKKLNVPNIMTLCRIALMPVTVLFILIPSGALWLNVVAAAFFILAALTDMFDGMIARNLNQVTNFGKFLDPIADKMLVMGALVAIAGADKFSYIRLFTVISVIVILLREFSVTSIRLIAAKADGTVIAANKFGKVKTLLSDIAVPAILLEDVIFGQSGLFGFHFLSYATLALALGATVISGVLYMSKYFSYIDPLK